MYNYNFADLSREKCLEDPTNADILQAIRQTLNNAHHTQKYKHKRKRKLAAHD